MLAGWGLFLFLNFILYQRVMLVDAVHGGYKESGPWDHAALLDPAPLL